MRISSFVLTKNPTLRSVQNLLTCSAASYSVKTEATSSHLTLKMCKSEMTIKFTWTLNIEIYMLLFFVAATPEWATLKKTFKSVMMHDVELILLLDPFLFFLSCWWPHSERGRFRWDAASSWSGPSTDSAQYRPRREPAATDRVLLRTGLYVFCTGEDGALTNLSSREINSANLNQCRSSPKT